MTRSEVKLRVLVIVLLALIFIGPDGILLIIAKALECGTTGTREQSAHLVFDYCHRRD